MVIHHEYVADPSRDEHLYAHAVAKQIEVFEWHKKGEEHTVNQGHGKLQIDEAGCSAGGWLERRTTVHKRILRFEINSVKVNSGHVRASCHPWHSAVPPHPDSPVTRFAPTESTTMQIVRSENLAVRNRKAGSSIATALLGILDVFSPTYFLIDGQ